MNERQGTSVSISNVNNTDEIKESIDSFMVEAQRLNKLSLNHPGIVRVNENFRANGTAYYVMEYVKGKSLRELVKQSPLGRLPEAEALELFRPIAETIGYLHENRVTHLDIKPDNILLRENGQPVVIDFGLSKHYSSKGTPTSTIKAAGCSAGYSPMEQYVGITSFTPEADIYALGATLLYMLTGKDPVVSTEINSDIICRSLPEGVSDKTTTAIVSAMGKLKENRPHSVEEWLNKMENHQQDAPKSEEEANQENHQNSTKKISVKQTAKPFSVHRINPKFHLRKVLWGMMAISLVVVGIIAYRAFAGRTNNSNEYEFDGEEYVDLGLPSGTLWATRNVGASKPEEYGDYFAWGETKGYKSGKRDFSWSTYRWCKGDFDKLTKYCDKSGYGNGGFTDNKTELDLEDDAAYVNWGSQWRMPSLDQIKELKNKCTWTWTQLNGVNGNRVTSKTNGNSIFLPAAGRRYVTSLDSGGYYWSRSLCASNPSNAYYLYFRSYGGACDNDYRCIGRSVRPVLVKNAENETLSWLEGSWRVETDYGTVVVTIRGNEIAELLPDGQLNRGTFEYKNEKLYCDFGEENLLMMKINKEKQHILYGNQPMEKQ